MKVQAKGKKSNAGKATAMVSGRVLELAQKRNAEEQAMITEGFDALRARAVEVTEPGVAKKELLEGVPFVIISTTYRPGANGDYVSVKCLLESGDVLIINDGGTGICEQLRGQEKFPIFVKGGLRASHYNTAHGPATTYYLSGRPAQGEIAASTAPARAGYGNGRAAARA
jgi:hypothetical protein